MTSSKTTLILSSSIFDNDLGGQNLGDYGREIAEDTRDLSRNIIKRAEEVLRTSHSGQSTSRAEETLAKHASASRDNEEVGEQWARELGVCA